ncbi:MobH family relaxase [Halomonas sp. 86]|uniref:MobH family relaxase n=1 Tax=unclassified Halomonas TaxID=2609666 RepID=UPI004034D36B
MLNTLKKWWPFRAGSTASSAFEQPGVYEHLEDLEDPEIPRYPPFAKGLPVTPIDKLMATQRKLIARIKLSLGFSGEDADQLLYPVLRNYASFVHLLPASEGHHHRGAGGLFRHGLEVAFYATQASEDIIFVPEGSPNEKNQKEPRWRYGVFLGALMHDLGKPLSDVVVTDKQGHHEWNPYAETLEQWLDETGVTRYFLRWNKARHQRHERLATLALNMVLTADAKRYLRLPGPELMKTLIEAISGTSALHPMAKLIMLADSESVKRDLKESRLNIDSNSLGVSIEPYIIDAIRGLVHSGRWKSNQMDAQVWHLEQGTFIAWRQAVPSLVQRLKDNSIPAVPHDPDTLADYLIDRGFAVPRPIPGRESESEENYYRYWEVTVEVEAEEGLTVEPTILMLRMEDSSLVFGAAQNPPQPMSATVPGLDASGQQVVRDETPAEQNEEGTAATEESGGSTPDENTQNTADNTVTPASMRERLNQVKNVDSATLPENMLKVLNGGAAVNPLPVASGPKPQDKISTPDNKDNSGNTDITDNGVGPESAPSIGTPDSINAIEDILSSLTPPKKGKKAAAGSGKKPEKKANTSTSDAPLQDDIFGDLLCPGKNSASTVPEKDVTGTPSTQEPTHTPVSTPVDAVSVSPDAWAVPDFMPETLQQDARKATGKAKPQPMMSGSVPAVTEKPTIDSPEPEDSPLARLQELSSSLGGDIGMDLPFSIPEGNSGESMRKEGSDDDAIVYEDLPMPEDKPSEVPFSFGLPEADTEYPVSTNPPEDFHTATNKKRNDESQSDRKITPSSSKHTATGSSLNKAEHSEDTQASSSEAVMTLELAEPLLASPKIESAAMDAPTSGHADVGHDLDFLLNVGSNSKNGQNGKKAVRSSSVRKSMPSKGTGTPKSAAAPDNPSVEPAQPIGVDGSLKIDSPTQSLPNKPAPATHSSVCSDPVGMPDFGQDDEVLLNDPPSAGTLSDGSQSLPPKDPVATETEPPIEEGIRSSVAGVEPVTTASLEGEPSGKSNHVTPDLALPERSGVETDLERANKYIQVILEPILKGNDTLGRILYRDEFGHLNLQTEPASKELGLSASRLLVDLAKGGAIAGEGLDQSANQAPLSDMTSEWVGARLKERESERIREMALALDGEGGEEKPSTSLVRRKVRGSPTLDTPRSTSISVRASTPETAGSPSSSLVNEHPGKPNDIHDSGPGASAYWEQAEDEISVPAPPQSLSANDALKRLREMVLAGEGEWLTGSVSKEGDDWSTSDICIDALLAANPSLSRTQIKNALRSAKHLKMSLVAKNKRLYVKE